MLLVAGIYIGRIGFFGSDYDCPGRDMRRPRGSRVNCHVGEAHTKSSFLIFENENTKNMFKNKKIE